MKGISKAIYVIAKICKVCGRIALGCIIAEVLIIPVITLNINVKNNNELNIFGEKINYEKNNEEEIIKDFIKKLNIEYTEADELYSIYS